MPDSRARSPREQGPHDGIAPAVLVSARPPRHQLDYVDQLIGDDSAGDAPRVAILEFRTDPTRVHGIDVVHLTDSATVVGDARTPPREQTRRAKRFVRLLHRRRIALVRTVHGDESAHTSPRADAILDAAAVKVIAMSPLTRATAAEMMIIGHSHLRERYLGFPRREPVPGRMLFTAISVLHLDYERAMTVCGVADAPGWSLRIAGKLPAEREESFLRTLADHTETMSLRDEVLSDAARVEEISQAEVVAIAAHGSYETHALVFLALSLDRPVLVEDSAQMRALADEVGPSWVRRHEGPLTARTLEEALAALRADPPTGRPDLDARDPNAVSARYAEVYRAAADRY